MSEGFLNCSYGVLKKLDQLLNSYTSRLKNSWHCTFQQHQISKYNSSYGFQHRRYPQCNTKVMTAFDGELLYLARFPIQGFLFFWCGRGGFYCNPKNKLVTCSNATNNATRMIGTCCSIGISDGIIMICAKHTGCCKAGAELNAFDRRN